MSTLKDVMSSMKEVLLLTDKVDRTGAALSESSSEQGSMTVVWFD